MPRSVAKMHLGQEIPAGEWDETVFAIGFSGEPPEPAPNVRLALPLYIKENDFAAMRTRVKRLVRGGHVKWEAADLATLRLLRQCGVSDVTADWSLYAFNREAIRQLAELGVRRFVCSPENTAENLDAIASLAEGPRPEFLVRQSTPLFISLTRPCTQDPSCLTGQKGDSFTAFLRDGLWITTGPEPRRFIPPASGIRRADFSWDSK